MRRAILLIVPSKRGYRLGFLMDFEEGGCAMVNTASLGRQLSRVLFQICILVRGSGSRLVSVAES